MFLRKTQRKKDGKTHEYWSVVENKRVAGGRVVRGKRLGRQPGQRPKSDRLAPKVLALAANGRSYRLIGREVGLSKNTVADIVKRHCAGPAQTA
jgi:hypothetical protein